ncbi:MAG TPA: replication-associated recombination protein A [Polyangiaceae bacterium]|nr:replication-associated recombination protein A [Polyangiaceae bacterium]
MAARKHAADAGPTLFGQAATRSGGGAVPLAERMRPRSLDEVVGQKALLAPGKLLRKTIESDRVPSLVLWGPPGSGKTTLAAVVARQTHSEFVGFSAVLGGLPELREIIKAARERRDYQGKSTILFVDEIHRFNKGQQDAFLPHIENGTITLIGATTENPSFAVNAALLSRCRVFRLEALEEIDLVALLERALGDHERGLGARNLSAEPAALGAMASAARGDARRALGLLEIAAGLLPDDGGRIDLALVERAAEQRTLLYDKSGEEHYNVSSALIKSLRGSDPDAALYWLFRMLDAGDDPLFLLRRLIIFASEDVGNADPRALSVAVDADAAFRRVGMPEGAYPIAHACLYLASCPKSAAVKSAMHAVRAVIAERGALPVPKKLRNAVTGLMRNEGYGEGYQYPPNFVGSFVPGETYLPDELSGERFYQPTQNGLEKAIAERLGRLRGGGQGSDQGSGQEQ